MKIFDENIPLGFKVVKAICYAGLVISLIFSSVYMIGLFKYVSVEAKVIDQRSESNDDNFYHYVTLEYEYGGSTYHAVQRVSYSDEYSIGGSKTVKINPNNPTQLKDYGMIGGYMGLCLFFIAALSAASFSARERSRDGNISSNKNPKSYLESDYEVEMRDSLK